MKTDQATEQLQTIRTLMERSALYRRALAPIMIFCGIVGIVGGVVGWQLLIRSDRKFTVFWSSAALISLTGAFILARRQAIKDLEPFWSPPTRRVAQAMLPPLFIGMVVGLFFAMFIKNEDLFDQIILITVWSWLYGCAIHSAGFFVSWGMRLFGLVFIAVGSVLLFCFRRWIESDAINPHLLMGIIFGGLHLAYGICLFLTEKRKNAA